VTGRITPGFTVPEPSPATLPASPPRARAVVRHLRHPLLLTLVGLGVVLAVAAGVLRWMVGPEVAVYPVRRADLVKTVVASGHVETPFRVEVGSQITGTVVDVLVDEGQSVTRGQPLIRLDDSELQAAVVQAEGMVAQAEARVRQMREVTRPSADQTLKQAQATLQNAQAAYDRAEQLARGGFGTRATLDMATKDLDVARTQVRVAEIAVFTTSPGGSDFVMAETQLIQAKGTLATAQARLAYATIAAPRDGVLITRNVERGAVVQAGKALLVLAPTGDVQLVVSIDEKNLGQLAVGQPALASADAYPDQRFAATLSYINPGVDISRASVEVKLTAKNPPPFLRQDMTVSVDIEVARRPGTLVVPARLVHDPGSAEPWVMVVRDGRALRQPITLGLRAGGQMEILSGAAAGDQLVPLAAGVRAGQRIRPVAS
jgi:HlyD family secretion protein